MKALVHGAEMVSSTKCRQFQVCQNRARIAATTWSDADRQKAIKRLERQIHQVTPAKCNLFNKVFQHHRRQLLQEVRKKATGPKSIFNKHCAPMLTAAEDEAYRAANMAANRCL
jgi:hypothetical protein